MDPMEHFKNEYGKFFDHFQQKCSQQPPPTTILVGPKEASSKIATGEIRPFYFCYEDYFKCFKDLEFGHQFLKFLNKPDRYVREFFDAIMDFILDRLSDEYPLESRIFAFYAMYSISEIMNTVYKNLKFKIRVDFDSWRRLKNLVQEALQQKQFDIAIACQKMFQSGAFTFCHDVKLYGPYYKEYLCKMHNLEKKSDQSEHSSQMSLYLSLLNELNIDTSNMEELSNL